MNIILHHPLPFNHNAKSASGIRPLRMYQAFESIGCEIDLVSGYALERKRSIAKIKENIRKGKKYEFVYSESSTMPTVLTDPHHLPLHPLADWLFFRLCKKNNIPVGLFYRDIYWLFEKYGEGLSPIKTALAKAAYQFDLWVYQNTLTKLYLPSMEMGKYIPRVSPEVFQELPPGHNSPRISDKKLAAKSPVLKLFYVGGMSSHYQLHKLFSVVRELPYVELTVCTRESEWTAVRKEYPKNCPNIQVIHKTGEEMEAILQETDIAMLFVKPQEYWEFASPVKLYEYLGHQKPILASEGTLTGRFVKEQGIGWTVPYEKKALRELLVQIISNPGMINLFRGNLENVAQRHTWQARARQVVEELTS